MKELSQPSAVPIPWTFQVRIPNLDPRLSGGDEIRVVALILETTVLERFAFDARKRAAQILGVDPASLELVK